MNSQGYTSSKNRDTELKVDGPSFDIALSTDRNKYMEYFVSESILCDIYEFL